MDYNSEVPLVSIGIPCYNAEWHIRRTLESCLEQDYPNIEIVVSDNQSTDGTWEVVCEVTSRYSKATAYRQLTNRGPTANFRSVLQKCQGEYFMWLSADDWLEPTFVSSCMEILRRDGSVSICSGRTVFSDIGGAECDYQPEPTEYVARTRLVRVWSYYRRVGFNNEFYGVFHRGRLAPGYVRAEIANDWHIFAQHLLSGKACVAKNAVIHRTIGGSSTCLEKLVRALGLPKTVGIFPIAYIAFGAAIRVLSNDLSVACGVERLLLSTGAFLAVLSKRDWMIKSFQAATSWVLGKTARSAG